MSAANHQPHQSRPWFIYHLGPGLQAAPPHSNCPPDPPAAPQLQTTSHCPLQAHGCLWKTLKQHFWFYHKAGSPADKEPSRGVPALLDRNGTLRVACWPTEGPQRGAQGRQQLGSGHPLHGLHGCANWGHLPPSGW